MMLHSEIHGRHLPGNGEGILLQDLYEFLKHVPRKARWNYLTVDGKDVLGISFGQSDQGEKWEFKISLIVGEGGPPACSSESPEPSTYCTLELGHNGPCSWELKQKQHIVLVELTEEQLVQLANQEDRHGIRYCGVCKGTISHDAKCWVADSLRQLER